MKKLTKKQKLIPLPKLLKTAQETVNKWVRHRDSELPCISCGEYHIQYDAGHYVPQGSNSFLRFHEWNINKEGSGCNAFDPFHLIGYRRNLIKKIGEENVRWLEENRRTIKKWSRQELELIIEKYKL